MRPGARPSDALQSALLLVLAAASPLIASRYPLLCTLALPLIGILLWRGRGMSTPLVHATIVTALIYILAPIPAVGMWPLVGACALAITAAVAWRRGTISSWREWARVGTITRQIWIWLGVIVILTVVGLLLWMHLVGGQLPSAYAAAAQSVPAWLAGLGGFLFLIVNGVVEDAIFFGVLLTAAVGPLRTAPAVTITSVAFGLAHFGGVPDGWIGVAMASTWGFVLAMLRVRTHGMLGTYLAHVAADATIIVMLLPGVLD
jgi:membrane protease YdiL (CAAX protease family)